VFFVLAYWRPPSPPAQYAGKRADSYVPSDGSFPQSSNPISGEFL